MPAFCEYSDVREALLERSLSGPLDQANTDTVMSTIASVSDWFARQTNGHWYDSTAEPGDLRENAPATASDVRLDVPSSPHRQDRQLLVGEQGVRYPVTHNGPYARIQLPHRYVQSVAALRVRDTGGGVDDWVADPSKTEGRGGDYYVGRPGQASYGQSYLFVRASSIGPRVDYNGLLTVDYEFGLDADEKSWQDVRRGVALASGAEVVIDDNVLSSIPDDGQLVGVDTQRQQLVDDAADKLDPYLGVAVA
jgi:hypothetical protein